MPPTRQLNYHHPTTPKQKLLALAEWIPDDATADHYGKGDTQQAFEAEIAALLGKEAAVWFPSGTMVQQIALRMWCDRRGSHTVLYHPTSHLAIHEQDAYRVLHHLHAVHLGPKDGLFTLADLQAVLPTLSEPGGALLIELPQREIGGQLPTWEELVNIVETAHQAGIYCHLDGARLWECGPYFGRPYAEIAALFDSVYVSLYKTMNGISGAMLAGPADFIEESRIWQRRHGGNLPGMYPYVLAGKMGLETHLPRIPEYVGKARGICDGLATIPGIVIVPNPPPTNMAHVHLKGEKEALLEAAKIVGEAMDMRLFGWLRDGIIPGYAAFELTIGDAGLEIPTDEIVEAFRRIMAQM